MATFCIVKTAGVSYVCNLISNDNKKFPTEQDKEAYFHNLLTQGN